MFDFVFFVSRSAGHSAILGPWTLDFVSFVFGIEGHPAILGPWTLRQRWNFSVRHIIIVGCFDGRLLQDGGFVL